MADERKMHQVKTDPRLKENLVFLSASRSTVATLQNGGIVANRFRGKPPETRG